MQMLAGGSYAGFPCECTQHACVGSAVHVNLHTLAHVYHVPVDHVLQHSSASLIPSNCKS